MIGLEEIRRCDEHPDVDFSDEKEVMRFVRPMKWLSLDVAGHRVLRINVRPPAIALAPLRDSIDRRSVSRAPARRDRSRAPRRACFERRRTRENLVISPNRHVVSASFRRLPAGTPARATRTVESPSPVPPTRTQWVSTTLAIALLWGFVIACLADPTEMSTELGSWKTWISRNTGWLFIAAFVRAPLESRTPFFLDANRHVTDHGFPVSKMSASNTSAKLTIHLFLV